VSGCAAGNTNLVRAARATWAVTTYSYGPDDLVATIVDPQSVTTSLVHDWAGRRTQITRHGRTWKYGYDTNGNMISEQVPGSSVRCSTRTTRRRWRTTISIA